MKKSVLGLTAVALAVVLAVSCRGEQGTSARNTAASLMTKVSNAVRSSLSGTPQDRLFNDYVKAYQEYYTRHPIDPKNKLFDYGGWLADLSSHLQTQLKAYNSMPEMYECLASTSLGHPEISLPLLQQAAKMAPDNWSVAFYAAGLPTGSFDKGTPEVLRKLAGLCSKFPDEAFLHYLTAFVALGAKDEKTAWEELRAGNRAKDLSFPMLFPSRYLHSKYMAETPPKLPFEAGSMISQSGFSAYLNWMIASKNFIKAWVKAPNGPEKPSATEVHRMACRFSAMEPMNLTGPLVAVITLEAIDASVGLDDLAAFRGGSPRNFPGDASAVGKGVRKLIQREGWLFEVSRAELFMDSFFAEKYLRDTGHPPSASNQAGSGSLDQWWKSTDSLKYIWETCDGGYLEWCYCEDEVKPILEQLEEFDYANPGAYYPSQHLPNWMPKLPETKKAPGAKSKGTGGS